MQEGTICRRYQNSDANIALIIQHTHMSLDTRVAWSKGYKNQFELLSLMDCVDLEMISCKLVYTR